MKSLHVYAAEFLDAAGPKSTLVSLALVILELGIVTF